MTPISNHKFNIGDLAQLKSGGPIMTVAELRTDMLRGDFIDYKCTWFNGKKLETGYFAEEVLNLHSPQDEASK
jgi:uncharacterized protein YodC (DUF2158 family)